MYKKVVYLIKITNCYYTKNLVSVLLDHDHILKSWYIRL